MHQRIDYNYELPQELIASRPAEQRSGSRLLVMQVGSCQARHDVFTHLTHYLQPSDLLIFNNTKVISARLCCRKIPGDGIGEALVERLLPEQVALCQLKFNRAPKLGQRLLFDSDSGSVEAEVWGRQGMFFKLRFLTTEQLPDMIERIGVMPLPPYIHRAPDQQDERYQTIYAVRPGAVAAPTAGLHFDEGGLAALSAQGINSCQLTLHVGGGTFQPVRVADIRQHNMHSEWCEISPEVVAAVKRCKAEGGRTIAVGTTSARTLEAAAQDGELKAFTGETDIFIYPPYRFRVIDGLITNFHMPQSTLLMLVCAFAGYDPIMAAYASAIEERYRFFSYGDAMLILPAAHV